MPISGQSHCDRVVAAIDYFQAISRHLHRSSGGTEFGYFVAVVAGLALLWLGFTALERWRKAWLTQSPTPQALFRELCSAHRLTRGERQMLQSITRGMTPEQRLQVFIDPALLGRAALSPTPEADAFGALLRRLFGDRALE